MTDPFSQNTNFLLFILFFHFIFFYNYISSCFEVVLFILKKKINLGILSGIRKQTKKKRRKINSEEIIDLKHPTRKY